MFDGESRNKKKVRLGNSETLSTQIEKNAENVLLTEIGSKWRRLEEIVGVWRFSFEDWRSNSLLNVGVFRCPSIFLTGPSQNTAQDAAVSC